MEIDFFGYYRHGYHEHSESNHGAPSQEYFDNSVQCKYGPLMCVARRLLHPKGAPIRSPLDRRGETPKGSIFSAHGLAWRRRVRIFYARDSRPHQRVQLFGSEWSPHLSRGVSTTDQNSLEPSICKGASIRSPLLTTCRGYARPKLRTLCHTRVKTRTLRRQAGPSVKNSNPSVLPSCQKCSGSPATKHFFFDLKVFLGNRFF